jgi:hypothetical protein
MLTVSPLAGRLRVFPRLKGSCSGLVFPLPNADDEYDLDEDALGAVFSGMESIAVLCFKSRKARCQVSEIWSYNKIRPFVRSTSSECLSLSVMFAIKSPLCFAVGHKLHSHAMRTGWHGGEMTIRESSLSLTQYFC